jgi:hypothetical protein
LEQQLDKLRTIEKENREKIDFLERHKAQKEELEKNLVNINIPDNSILKKQLGQKIESHPAAASNRKRTRKRSPRLLVLFRDIQETPRTCKLCTW